MLSSIRSNKSLQLAIGLLIGTGFGFLLQKGGLTSYNVIVGQLLFTDFSVLKTMMTAVITGMIGVHLLKSAGLIIFHPKQGSLGATVIGGLIFGAGFALLGYCPGTVVGAAAQGSFDALFGGIAGITIGAGLFAALYPRLEKANSCRRSARAHSTRCLAVSRALPSARACLPRSIPGWRKESLKKVTLESSPCPSF